MHRSSLFLPLVLLSCFSVCRAQAVSGYLTLNVTNIPTVATGVAATPGGYQTQYTSITPVGFGGGFTLRVLPLPLVSVGLDVRGSTRPGLNGQDNGLFGVKLTGHTPGLRLRPYVEGAAGFLATHTANVSPPASGLTSSNGRITSHYSIYQFLGGVDYKYLPHLDLRLIEVGGGSSFGASRNTRVLSINTGAVLYF